MTRQECYEKYDGHAKLNLDQKHRLECLVNEIVALLRNAGISHSPGVEPMSDVDALVFQFPADGVSEGFGLHLGGFGSCGVVVAMEPEPGAEADREFDRKDCCDRVRTP